jgi:hypothetical protein
MTRTGRKQLSVQITEESFDQFNQLKEKYNLSNAKLVELLIQTSINTTQTTAQNTPLTEERLKIVLTEVLSSVSSPMKKEEVEEKPKKKLITMTPEEIEASCTYEDVSPPIPEWDEQKWLDEDFMEFSNDPNPPEIIRTKKVEEIKPSIADDDDDW